jgi:hypothetical protein
MRDVLALVLVLALIQIAITLMLWGMVRLITWIARVERAKRELARTLAARRASWCRCQLAEAERGVE